MRQETKQKLKKMAGFAFAGVVVLIARRIFGADLATMAFIHIAVLFIMDYMHNNPLRYSHIMTVFFWIFYLMPFYINIDDPKATIYKIIICMIAAAFVAVFPHLLRARFINKDKSSVKPQTNYEKFRKT